MAENMWPKPVLGVGATRKEEEGKTESWMDRTNPECSGRKKSGRGSMDERTRMET
jgi:hypothetical protein